MGTFLKANAKSWGVQVQSARARPGRRAGPRWPWACANALGATWRDLQPLDFTRVKPIVFGLIDVDLYVPVADVPPKSTPTWRTAE
jgi:hypothetical protein